MGQKQCVDHSPQGKLADDGRAGEGLHVARCVEQPPLQPDVQLVWPSSHEEGARTGQLFPGVLGSGLTSETGVLVF